MKAIPVERFAKQLTDSGVLDSDTLRAFLPPRFQPKDTQHLATELVRRKKLTKFQAAEAYRGNARALVLGNYVLLDKLGAGGMGQVYKARHRRMDRLVALKLLPAKLNSDPQAIARFEREVRAAAKLRHPNIVAADDADEAHGVHFLVMEFVDGSDLTRFVEKNGPLKEDKAVECLLQAARGLEFAHQEGVIHRDIKPANLLLDRKGNIKILDMGLARLSSSADFDDNPELTSTGTIMGTANYMAPEQAIDTKSADARADIYSLGCSLYYLLCGKAMYECATLMRTILAHRDEPAPSLRAIRPEISERLDQVFQKMVAKTVERRYQTMTEVIAALDSCRGHSGTSLANTLPTERDVTGEVTNFLQEIAANPRPRKRSSSASPRSPSPASSVWRRCSQLREYLETIPRAKKFLIIGGATIALSLMTGALGWGVAVGWKKLRGERTQATSPNTTESGREDAPAASTRNRNALPISSDGWIGLIGEDSLIGWRNVPERMTAKDGVVTIDNGQGTAIAPGNYDRFELRLEFRLTNGADSGVGILYPGTGNPAMDGLEIQLTDDLGKEDNRPDERCGSLYRVAPAQNHPFRRWPEWNRLRVVTTADSIRVEMNDQLVVDADRRQLQRQFPEHRGLKRKLGGICLYPIAGKSEYRGMWIRPLR